ncbi:MAG: hypothetical protein FJZ80_05840 [Bacteroidetes bacterium]|nr:hypothetical protein [Bacteroidota bacterium]
MLFIPQSLIGQQRFLNNQRLWNDLMFNPAKIVEVHGINVYTLHRQQYYTLRSQSPYLFMLGGKANLPMPYSQNMLYSEKNYTRNYNLAVGGYYIHSFTGGVYDQNEIAGQFGFQLKLHQEMSNPSKFDQLNFGISIKGINNRYRGNSGLYLYDSNDPQFMSQQATNKFTISAIPGVQYKNHNLTLDAFHTFGPKDQHFTSLSVMGSSELDNYLAQLAFRINYFGSTNYQVSLNKIQHLNRGKQLWALNYGANLFIGKKTTGNSSILSNPGIYIGIVFTKSTNPKKTTRAKTSNDNYKEAQHAHLFSGSVNVFDANWNTISLGPSTEVGLMYQRNTKVCECDRIYDQFLAVTNTLVKRKEEIDIEEAKELELKFETECRKSYGDYEKFIAKMREKTSSLKPSQQIDFDTTTKDMFGTRWLDHNLDYIGSGIKLITNLEEWKELNQKAENSPWCCYVDFDAKNKNKGLLYNEVAFELLSKDVNLKERGFKIANGSDWTDLWDEATEINQVNSLFNCDGSSTSVYNLNFEDVTCFESGGFYVNNNASYWVGELKELKRVSCSLKRKLKTDFPSESSAYLIRLVKL